MQISAFIDLNQHLSKTVWTKSEHYNLLVASQLITGLLCLIAFVLAVYLMKQQVSCSPCVNIIGLFASFVIVPNSWNNDWWWWIYCYSPHDNEVSEYKDHQGLIWKVTYSIFTTLVCLQPVQAQMYRGKADISLSSFLPVGDYHSLLDSHYGPKLEILSLNCNSITILGRRLWPTSQRKDMDPNFPRWKLLLQLYYTDIMSMIDVWLS